MIFKNNSDVRYTLEACAEMVKKLTKSSVAPPASESMITLRDDIIYHMVEQQDGTIIFSDINDETIECSAFVSQPFIDNLLNVYAGTAVVFHHYERLIDSFSPNPLCQTLQFNIPSNLRTDTYQMYPRIVAILLNAYTVKSTICTQLIHDDSSPSMPDSF